ncbi:hypothetical protein F4809DRAFT_607372 [Biscogniauxia mediterranea]|nr:hypothetical protein F4809DRAFT_607372 [Biscogniauxia mediterranea]
MAPFLILNTLLIPATTGILRGSYVSDSTPYYSLRKLEGAEPRHFIHSLTCTTLHHQCLLHFQRWHWVRYPTQSAVTHTSSEQSRGQTRDYCLFAGYTAEFKGRGEKKWGDRFLVPPDHSTLGRLQDDSNCRPCMRS